MKKNSRSKHGSNLAILASMLVLAMLFSSCENILNGPDLNKTIKNEVRFAKAKDLSLSIQSMEHGATNPNGLLAVKEGYEVTITAIPDPDYEIVGWKTTGGSGAPSFTKLDGKTVKVSIAGGDTSIAPVYEERPRVLYSLPTGNNIYIDAKTRVYFNRDIAQASYVDGGISLIKPPNTKVDGSYNSAGSAGAVFFPASYLSPGSSYIITATTGIYSPINAMDANYAGVFILNDKLYMRSLYSKEFLVTGATTNNTNTLAPSSGTVSPVFAENGDAFYTRTTLVKLKNLGAISDSGIARYAAFGGSAKTVFSIDNSRWSNGNYIFGGLNTYFYNPVISDPFASSSWQWYWEGMEPTLTLPTGDGRKYVTPYFQDYNGKVSLDTNTTEGSIILDTTPPSVSAFTVNTTAFQYATVPVVPSTAVQLTINAADPNAGTLLGSGESSNGVAVVNRKTISFQDPVTGVYGTPTPFSNTSSQVFNLASGADGLRVARANIADGIGNVADAFSYVLLDTTAPNLDFVAETGSLYTNDVNQSLMLTTSDPNSPDGYLAAGVTKLSIGASSGLVASSAFAAYAGGGVISGGNGTLNGSSASTASFNFGSGDRLDVVLAPGNGSRTVSLSAIDGVGNTKTVSKDILLDTTAPTITSISINNGVAATNNPNVSVSIAGATDSIVGGVASGVSQMAFSNTNSTVGLVWIGYSASATSTIPSVNGSQTVYAWIKDAAGNVSAVASDSITYDNTPPDGTISLSTSYTKNAAISVNYVTTTAVTIELSNDGSAWTSYSVSGNPSPLSWNIVSGAGGSASNGARKVYARFTKASGAQISTSAPFTYDTVAPVISSFTIAGGAAAVNYAALARSVSISDAGTPAASLLVRYSNDNSTWTSWSTYSASPGAWDITSGFGGSGSQGTKTVYLEVKDALGQVSATSRSVVYDTIAPVAPAYGVFVLNGTGVVPGQANAYTRLYSNTLTTSGATDASGSGVVSMQFSNDYYTRSTAIPYNASTVWNLSTGAGGSTVEGTRYVYMWVYDAAGNVSNYTYCSVILDVTAPTGTFSIEGGNPAQSFYRSNTFMSQTVSDATSGVYDMRYYDGRIGYSSYYPYSASFSSPAWVLPVGNGLKGMYGIFRDKAGNEVWLYDTIDLQESYASLSVQDIYAVYNDSAGRDSSYMSAPAFPYTLSAGIIGKIVVFKTGAGNYGKYIINSWSASSLSVSITTWSSAGSVLVNNVTLVIPSANGTLSYFDLDTGTNGTYNASASDYAFWGSSMYSYTGLTQFQWN